MGNISSKRPAVNMIRRKQKALARKYIPGEASEFYFACRNNDIDYVREHIKTMSIEEIDKLEPNGSTALHVATYNDNKEIVQLLLNEKCSRTILNLYGRTPYEEIQSAEMQKLYERPTLTRFHESDPNTSLASYKPDDQEQQEQLKRDYINIFENDKELMNYLKKQQTAVMWLKFFNWSTHRFSRVLDRTDFNAKLFDLNYDRDFDEFLKRTIPNDDDYKRAKQALIEAEQDGGLIPLIVLYTSEFKHGGIPFYEVLNKQLALSSENDINTAHFCDRFVREFDMKSDELKTRAHTGMTYRGVTMNDPDIEKYERLSLIGKKKGIIATKSFQSTSKNKQRAMDFAQQNNNRLKCVLFIFNISKPCPTIFSVEDVSEFPHEEEILIMPGNLFKVKKVVKRPDLTEIHLEHMKVTISAFTKIHQTMKAVRYKTDDE